MSAHTNQDYTRTEGNIRGILAAAGAFLLSLGISHVAYTGSVQADPTYWQENDAEPPVASFFDDLLPLIDDLITTLDEAENVIINNGTQSLNSEEKSSVKTSLDDAVAIVNQILDPTQYPSLSTTGTPAVDPLITPDTLDDYAFETTLLAETAMTEMLLGEELADQDFVASRLETIRYLINRAQPHNYRTRAGL